MAILKINEEKMTKQNKKRKPTNQDFVNVINSLIRDVEVLQNNDNTMMQAFELYIEYKKDTKDFDNFCRELSKTMEDNNELQKAGQDNTVTDKTHSQN